MTRAALPMPQSDRSDRLSEIARAITAIHAGFRALAAADDDADVSVLEELHDAIRAAVPDMDEGVAEEFAVEHADDSGALIVAVAGDDSRVVLYDPVRQRAGVRTLRRREW